MYLNPDSFDPTKCSYCKKIADVNETGMCKFCASDPAVIAEIEKEIIAVQELNRYISNFLPPDFSKKNKFFTNPKTTKQDEKK